MPGYKGLGGGATRYQDAWNSTQTLLDNWVQGTYMFIPYTRPWTGVHVIQAGAPNRLRINALGVSPETEAFPLIMVPNMYGTAVNKKPQYAKAQCITFSGGVGSKVSGPVALASYQNNAGGGGSFYIASIQTDANLMRLLAWNGGVFRVLVGATAFAVNDIPEVRVTNIAGGSNTVQLVKNGIVLNTVVDSDGTRPVQGISGWGSFVFSDGVTDVLEFINFDGGAL